MYKISFGFEREIFVVKLSKVKKANDTLVFRNKLNSIIFPSSFTARDYDIFFTICWYAKQYDYDNMRGFIEMPFDEVARFYYKDLNKTRFYKEICEFVGKIFHKNDTQPFVYFDNGDNFGGSFFFLDLEACRNKRILRFKLNKKSLNLLFAVFDFMNINMKDFVSIRGKFSKFLYRLLKQYENVKSDENGLKNIYISKSNFIKFMQISNLNYDVYDLDRRVLLPAIKELKDLLFKDLSVEKIKKNKREVVGYSFQVIF